VQAISLKHVIQRYKIGRQLLRSIVLTARFFDASLLLRKLMSSRKIRTYIIKSSLANQLITNYSSLTFSFFQTVEDYAYKKKDFPLLYKISQIYRLQRRYKKAFDILFHLSLSAKNEIKIVHYTVKALQVERFINNKKLMKYYQSDESALPIKAIHFLECEYTLHSERIKPDWNAIIKLLENEYDYALANFLILAALGHQKINYIDKVKNLLVKIDHEKTRLSFERAMTMIAAAYYRSGEKEKLQQLDKLFKIDSTSWEIYMSFGKGKILEAMNYRGETIKSTFLRFYPYKLGGDKEILTPEKDICGEAFNPLFYSALSKSKSDITIICDNRLYTILLKTFPYIHFIPKTPRYIQKTNTENFDQIHNYNLRDFLDNHSFKQSKGSNFFTLDYTTLYEHEETKLGRRNGWFNIDEDLKSLWKNKLGSSKKLIGISGNSTLRSRIRDMHMISMDHWEEIFNLPNCKFVNLNASLEEEDIKEYSKKFNIEFINPNIDLFNDFDNLLAIMSILDFAIVPANNLMDFASSVGTDAIVFSPSNIMKTWATKNQRYIFSDNVKFIFPENNYQPDKINIMVKEGTDFIKNKIYN
jgi:hypothetical protein